MLVWCSLSPDPLLGRGTPPPPGADSDHAQSNAQEARLERGRPDRLHDSRPCANPWLGHLERRSLGPITLNERINFEAELGHAPECELCAAHARRESASP